MEMLDPFVSFLFDGNLKLDFEEDKLFAESGESSGPVWTEGLPAGDEGMGSIQGFCTVSDAF